MLTVSISYAINSPKTIWLCEYMQNNITSTRIMLDKNYKQYVFPCQDSVFKIVPTIENELTVLYNFG